MREDLVRDHDRLPSNRPDVCRHDRGSDASSRWSAPPVSPSVVRTKPACRRSSARSLRKGRFAAAHSCVPTSVCSGVTWRSPVPVAREIRPKPGHPMLQNVRCGGAAIAPRALSAPTSRCGAPQPDAPWRRPTDQTSMPGSPATGLPWRPQDHSGKQRRPVSRSPHGRQHEGRSTDAKDIVALETRYRGRSQALLYNEVRPHSAIGARTPLSFIHRPRPGVDAT
jgi:hypothetical protein